MTKYAPVAAVVLAGAAAGVGVVEAHGPATEADPVATEIVAPEGVWLAPSDVRFTDVRDLDVGPRGVWVLDGVEPYLTLVSPEGRTLLRQGRSGRGPSELANPLALEASETGGVRVWDSGNARVVEYDADGTLIGTRAMAAAGFAGVRADIRRVTYADPFRVRRVGDSYVVAHYPGRISRTADLVSGALVRVDPTLARVAPIVAFSTEAIRMSSAEMSVEFTAVPLWDGCGELLATWLPESGSVRWYDVTGAVRSEVPVQLDTRDVTLDDIEAYLHRMARLELGPGYEQVAPNIPAMARQQRQAFALEAPAATELRCGTDGSAWLRTFDTTVSPVGLGSDWVRVRRSGVVTRVSFPDAFEPRLFGSDDAVGVWTDELGLQRLARWAAAPRGIVAQASTDEQ